MDDRQTVLRETAILAAGEVIFTAAMIGVFALIHQLDSGVVLGGIAGCLVTVGNFFFLAVTASLAARRAMEQDVEGGKKLLKLSQTFRFFSIAAIMGLLAWSKVVNLIAMILPLLIQQPVFLVAEFFRKKGD